MQIFSSLNPCDSSNIFKAQNIPILVRYYFPIEVLSFASEYPGQEYLSELVYPKYSEGQMTCGSKGDEAMLEIGQKRSGKMPSSEALILGLSATNRAGTMHYSGRFDEAIALTKKAIRARIILLSIL